MKKSYIFIYSSEVGTREQVREFLDKNPLINIWRYELPSAFYIVSEASANELADEVLKYTGRKGKFLIVECTYNSQGWLQKRTWTVLNKKYLPPKGEDA